MWRWRVGERGEGERSWGGYKGEGGEVRVRRRGLKGKRVFIKEDISRCINAIQRKVKTKISLMSNSITKEYTRRGPRS